MYTLKILFSSGTRISLLKLFLFSSKKYHLRELSRKIKVSPVYAAKELKNLEKINLIKKERLANLNLYSINNDNNIKWELKEIFRKCKN